jgi:TonB family protein
MTGALTGLLAYSAQVFAVVTVATVAVAIVRLSIPQARLVYWRAVAALCLGLPLLATQRTDGLVSTVLGPATVANARVARSAALLSSVDDGIVGMVAFGVLARLFWLLLGAWHLRQLRLRSVPATIGADLEALRMALSPGTQFRWTEHLRQPVAFGLRRPVVLLPRQFEALDLDAQRAVACHELAHIARRDWLWIIVEELSRALWWFHPAVWWLLDKLHLSREQVVDQFVVARTGSRKAYMRALLMFADTAPATAAAIPFLRRRHLAARLVQLSKEVRMSRLRLVCAASLLFVVVGGATWAAVSTLPLSVSAFDINSSTAGSDGQSPTPSPSFAASATAAAQTRRIKVGGNIQRPAKLFDIPPVYPEDAQAAGIQGVVLLDIVIGEDGSVIDSEVAQSIPELDQPAIDAVNQWLFEPTLLNGEPVEVEMTVTIRFTLS